MELGVIPGDDNIGGRMFGNPIDHITAEIHQKINSFQSRYELKDVGKVIETGDGIASVEGLANVGSQELVQFENGIMGIVFNLEKTSVGVIILGDASHVRSGMVVKATGRIISVPVGEGLIGRVINPLGQPLDGKGALTFSHYRPMERIAAGVIERQDVNEPVQTGIKAIDSMIPIGRGQRELIIGDRQTGKTALAIDTIINQKGKDLFCIYVAIGQKKAAVARTVAVLEQMGAMEHTVVVVASADDAAALQYIAPYAGCAIGEDFMDRGRDALVVYDDLSKHAWAYRQVSLLLRRPPGREAYPGDVFYLHSRLLERAARLADKYVIVPNSHPGNSAEQKDSINQKVYDGPRSYHDAKSDLEQLPNSSTNKVMKVTGSGGSLTALPIIETLLGDVSAYIPTNVISITDGQIYLETNLFNAGIRPAINVGISVSRVGGSAQTNAMRQVAGRLRLDMAMYRDLAAFAQFGSDLDKSTQAQINRGQRLQEILKQEQYDPMPLAEEVIILFAGTNGYADQIPIEKVRDWEKDLIKYISASYPEFCKEITFTSTISTNTIDKLKTAIDGFNSTWVN